MSFADTIIENLSDISSDHEQRDISGSYVCEPQPLLPTAANPTKRVGSTSASQALTASPNEKSPSSSTRPPSQQPAEPIIAANDYSDRQRLLYHITYLSTQLQRQQLQLKEQHRTITILHATARSEVEEDDEDAEYVTIRCKKSSVTAALLAVEEENEVCEVFQNSLASFDPILAQAQINRLDNALAHLGMLREAELQRLQKCTDELETVVGQRNALSQQVASLQRHLEEVTHQSEESTTALRSATLEVDRLRNEELRLNRRLAALEDFRGDYPTAVAQRPTVTADSAALHDGDAVRQLMREEESERQELLLALFWEPMLIAFDAGLTWIADCEALRDEPHTAKSAASIPIPEEIWERKEVVPYQENRSYTNKGALTPPKDEDLLLLTNQQSEIVQLNSKVQLLQERLRICQLEKERFSFLYEGEQRRIEMLTQDHNEQLRRAYDELLRDREYIMRTLKDEIEDQVRNSFEDGCRYQRRQMRGKKSETEKQLVVTSKNKRH